MAAVATKRTAFPRITRETIGEVVTGSPSVQDALRFVKEQPEMKACAEQLSDELGRVYKTEQREIATALYSAMMTAMHLYDACLKRQMEKGQ
jgi:hypothetical protein